MYKKVSILKKIAGCHADQDRVTSGTGWGVLLTDTPFLYAVHIIMSI